MLATVSGPALSILTAERVALNFLGPLSGTATATAALYRRDTAKPEEERVYLFVKYREKAGTDGIAIPVCFVTAALLIAWWAATGTLARKGGTRWFGSLGVPIVVMFAMSFVSLAFTTERFAGIAMIVNDLELYAMFWIAINLVRSDEDLDALYNSIFRELLTYMMEDPRNIGICIHLLFCAKNIERMGDHATNIAETVFYMIEGQQIVEKRPKGDMTTFANATPGN